MAVYIGSKKVSSKKDVEKLSKHEKEIYDRLPQSSKDRAESSSKSSRGGGSSSGSSTTTTQPQEQEKTELTQKQIEVLKKENIPESEWQSVVWVSPQTFSKISELKKEGKNPVIYNNQIYEDKAPVVQHIVQNETMKETLQRATFKQQWERKRWLEDVKDQTRERMMQDWQQKKAKAELEKKSDLNYAKDHPEDYFTPPRKKSGQESIDVTTSMDWRPFVKLDDTVPSKDRMDKSNRDQIQQERKRASEDLSQAKRSLEWDWNHPIESARSFSDTWGMNLDVKKQELQAPINDLGLRSSDATLGMIDLSVSSESINPMEYSNIVQGYETEIEASKTGIKAPVVAMAGTAFISVAKGAKNVFVDMPLHPVESAKNLIMMPFNAPEIIVQEGKAIMQDPIGAPIELATEMWAFGKVTEGAVRVLRPKVTETPVKGKSVKSLKTMRKDPKTGKVMTDQQIQIETELGKPKERYFWEDSKVKQRKNLNVEFERTTRSNFKGAEVLEGTSKAKGTLSLKDSGSKAKLTKKSVIESQAPKVIYDLDQAVTGKTGTGVKLSGKTGKLKESVGVDLVEKTRKGHTRTIPDTVEGIYKDGEYITMTKKGKTVQVKPSSKTEVRATGSKTYRSKDLASGDLILEEQMSGQFVKRQYNKKNPSSDIIPKPPKDPEFMIELDSKGNIKSVKDLKATQTTESGKKLDLGRKPLSPQMQSFSDSLEASFKDFSAEAVGKSSSKQEMLSEVKEISQTAKDSPIIDVISENVKAKGVSMPLFSLEETSQPKGRSFLPKVKQDLINETIEGSDLKMSMFTDLELDNVNKTDLNPIIDTFNDQRSDSLLMSFFGSTSDISTTQDLINPPDQIYDPVVDIMREQRSDQIITPIQLPDQIGGHDYKFDDLIEFTEKWDEIIPPKDKESKDPFDDEFLKGFDVFVKSKGKFSKINKRGSLSREEALMMGADIVENTASATFKVIESDAPLAMGSRSRIKDKLILDQFYEKGDNEFIERSRYRINTQGEVSGISALGHIARQTKGFIREAQDKLPKMMDEFAVSSMTGNKKGRSKDLFGGLI